MTDFGNCRAVRVRGTGYDDNGDPISGSPNRQELCNAAFVPGSSSDIDGRGRNGVSRNDSLLVPYGTALLHTDQVELYFDGSNQPVLYDVNGEVAQYKNPFTQWNAGAQVEIKRAAG